LGRFVNKIGPFSEAVGYPLKESSGIFRSYFVYSVLNDSFGLIIGMNAFKRKKVGKVSKKKNWF